MVYLFALPFYSSFFFVLYFIHSFCLSSFVNPFPFDRSFSCSFVYSFTQFSINSFIEQVLVSNAETPLHMNGNVCFSTHVHFRFLARACTQCSCQVAYSSDLCSEICFHPESARLGDDLFPRQVCPPIITQERSTQWTTPDRVIVQFDHCRDFVIPICEEFIEHCAGT